MPLAAAASAPGGLGLFVRDPRLLDPSGPARRTFVYRCLRQLDDALGGRLLVVRGDPVAVVPRLAAAAGAEHVHVAADYRHYGSGLATSPHGKSTTKPASGIAPTGAAHRGFRCT